MKTGNNNFRVRYDGQPETCRLCNQQGHFAAACPAKNRTHSHPKGRPTTGMVTTYADAASAPAPVGQVSLTITHEDRAKRLLADAETPIADQDSRSHEQHLATDKDVETELASAEAEESETHDTTNYKNATTGRKKGYHPSLILTPICTIKKRQRNTSTTQAPAQRRMRKSVLDVPAITTPPPPPSPNITTATTTSTPTTIPKTTPTIAPPSPPYTHSPH